MLCKVSQPNVFRYQLVIKGFQDIILVNKEASFHKLANHDFLFPLTPSTNQPRRHRCSKNIGPKWRTASFRLRLGDSEENHPKWPHCQDAIPKQWWLHWIPQTWTFIPKILEVVFFTTRRKATRFAAWFVLTYWCYIVCLFYRWDVKKKSAFSQVSWNNDIIQVFFFFFFKCSFMIKQEAYMNILDRDKLVRAGLALIDAVTFFFVLCFFFFFTFHIHIATAASIDLYCFKLTWSLWNHSFTMLQSHSPH